MIYLMRPLCNTEKFTLHVIQHSSDANLYLASPLPRKCTYNDQSQDCQNRNDDECNISSSQCTTMSLLITCQRNIIIKLLSKAYNKETLPYIYMYIYIHGSW